MISFFRNKITIVLLLFVFAVPVFAEEYDSGNFSVKDPVLGNGFGVSTSTNFQAGQSLGQTAIGSSSSTNFQVLSGFQYFFSASPNVLTASSGDGQVQVSWTAPQLFLGVQVSSYELGVGTVSGSYTYQNVGSVTSFTKTGLNNSTPYFFKIKARSAGGLVLSYSNEATATPQATSGQPGGGSGGGGGSYSAQVKFSGYAAPNSQVLVLLNGRQVASGPADEAGRFEVSAGNLPTGLINFSLYYKDPEGVRSDFVLARVNVTGLPVEASGILLPPTIRADKAEVKVGDSVRVWGYTLPRASVLLDIKSKEESVLTSKEGKYEILISTDGLSLGAKTVKTKAVLGNLSTPFSSSLKFLIGAQNIPVEETGRCPLKGDFNSDCRVDLVDFSILAYWYKRTNFPSEVDMNSDGKMDLVDFSIFAFYWTD